MNAAPGYNCSPKAMSQESTDQPSATFLPVQPGAVLASLLLWSWHLKDSPWGVAQCQGPKEERPRPGGGWLGPVTTDTAGLRPACPLHPLRTLRKNTVPSHKQVATLGPNLQQVPTSQKLVQADCYWHPLPAHYADLCTDRANSGDPSQPCPAINSEGALELPLPYWVPSRFPGPSCPSGIASPRNKTSIKSPRLGVRRPGFLIGCVTPSTILSLSELPFSVVLSGYRNSPGINTHVHTCTHPPRNPQQPLGTLHSQGHWP